MCVSVCVCAFGLVCKSVFVCYIGWVSETLGKNWINRERDKSRYSSLTLVKVSLSLRCLMTLFEFGTRAVARSNQLHSAPLHKHIEYVFRIFSHSSFLVFLSKSWWALFPMGQVNSVFTRVALSFYMPFFAAKNIIPRTNCLFFSWLLNLITLNLLNVLLLQYSRG